MHNFPQILLNSSMPISSRNESKRLYTIHDSWPPMQFAPLAKNHAISLIQMQTSFTTQKKECIYILCLILMYKESKYKSFDDLLLSIRRKSPMQMQKARSDKGFKQSMHSKQLKKTSRNLF
jgi:hypothetical protein